MHVNRFRYCVFVKVTRNKSYSARAIKKKRNHFVRKRVEPACLRAHACVGLASVTAVIWPADADAPSGPMAARGRQRGEGPSGLHLELRGLVRRREVQIGAPGPSARRAPLRTRRALTRFGVTPKPFRGGGATRRRRRGPLARVERSRIKAKDASELYSDYDEYLEDQITKFRTCWILKFSWQSEQSGERRRAARSRMRVFSVRRAEQCV